MLSIGLDIGGANTKAILLRDGRVERAWLEHIPLWKEKERLPDFLAELAEFTKPDVVGATMTAELCDVFPSKRQGVIEIATLVCEAFGSDKSYFVSLDGSLLSLKQALESPERLAAANWVAGALAVGREFPDCTLIDAGSTTTDIIPVRGGKPAARGKTDLERLKAGELVYTGVLRTPLPFISNEVRLGGERFGLAAENFAIAADVYRVLGKLSEEEYSCETPDGRGKDVESCMRRIARALCSDLEEIGGKAVAEVARYFYERQVASVAGGLRKVMTSVGRQGVLVGCGMGRRTLASDAARSVGLDEPVDFAEVCGMEAALMTPAFGAGLLGAEVSRWRQ
jgi:hypothetical protein